MKKYKYSYSRLKMFEKCPFMFQQYVINKIERKPTLAMAIGEVAHKVFYEYTMHCLKNKLETDLGIVENIAIDVFNREGILESQYLPDILELAKLFANSHLINYKHIVGAEEEVAITEDYKLTDWEGEDVFFRSKIDRLQIKDKIAKITDYKTGWGIDYDKFQLMCYAWIVSKIYPQLEWFIVECDFVRFETTREEEYSLEDIRKIERHILKMVNRIENTAEFKPTPCDACEECPYWSICPADVKGIERIPENKEEANKLAEEIIKLEALLKMKKDLLKSYCEENGNLIVNGLEIGHFKTQTIKYNPHKFILLLNEHGYDALDYMTVDNRKVKKLEKDEKLKPELDKLKEIDISVRFDKKKVKEEEMRNE